MVGFLDSIGGFFDDYGDIIKPFANLGGDLIKHGSRGNAQDRLTDIMKGQEQANFDYTNQYNAALKDWYGQNSAASAANAAAARANAAARASAAAATEKNRQRAAGKANKRLNQAYGEAKGLFDPYVQAGKELLPQMTKTYASGLGGLNMMNAYLNQPEQMAKMNQSVPAYATGSPVPSWAKKK